MGVKQCNRRGCQSIMCDHYSGKYGYICVECRNELLNVSQVMSIPAFMDSLKIESSIAADVWVEVVTEEFPSQTNYDLGGDV